MSLQFAVTQIRKGRMLVPRSPHSPIVAPPFRRDVTLPNDARDRNAALHRRQFLKLGALGGRRDADLGTSPTLVTGIPPPPIRSLGRKESPNLSHPVHGGILSGGASSRIARHRTADVAVGRAQGATTNSQDAALAGGEVFRVVEEIYTQADEVTTFGVVEWAAERRKVGT